MTTTASLPSLGTSLGTSLGWLALTVIVYALSRRLAARTRNGLLNPALVSIAVVVALLALSRAPFPDYARATRPLTLLLGPAVVALGVPLARQLATVRRDARAIGVALTCGGLAGIVSALGVARALGAPTLVVRSLAARSVTTPIAMAVTARAGGIPALAAVVSIVTGAIGAAVGPTLLRRAGVTSPLAVGVALGTAAHGIGTARAVDEGEVEGATSGMAMGLNGVFTAVVAPFITRLLT